MRASVEELPAIVEELLGQPVEKIELQQGGRNNLVARADLPQGPVLAKAYYRSCDDPRDRLAAEHGLLSHLWHHGVESVPEPLAIDPSRGVGIYEFIEGRRVAPGTVAERDGFALAALLGEMWSLKEADGADLLGPASDASLQPSSVQTGLERRFRALQAFPVLDSTDREADSFLKGTLRDVIDRESERAAEQVGAEAWTRDVPATLSPSDHGFHNALRTPSGELRFLDFEYGGFDDPAKALADAVLQPAVPIPPDLRSSFLEAAWARFDRSPELAHRLRCLYPLWAVNWCLITLNEFLPLVRERRRFAGSAEAREAQLRRSEAILANLQRDQVPGLAFLPGE